MRIKLLSIFTSIEVLAVILTYFFTNALTVTLCVIASSLFILCLYDIVQKRHSLLRNFPIVGRLRWIMEGHRPKIQQYFVEDNLNGAPFPKEDRDIGYQRAKGDIDTVPFGTQHNVYDSNHQFVKHSIFPKHIQEHRVKVGSKHCKRPYDSSLINISAMSFGSLSGAAIRALNKGAKAGNFAHNTGEGGISEHHLQGGDLIFQFGTGYFGAGYTNVEDGKRYFDAKAFEENATRPEVKMVEIKLSQGAKPGHGGILPAKKNTEEIAKIRGIEPHTRVDSPPYHTAFDDFNSMVDFIIRVRELSGGKPVGIKMCVGQEKEVIDMIKTFKKRDVYPDFISVDGSEGGTGSAPKEFTNHVGTPLREGLKFVVDNLKKNGLRSEIKVFASGKVMDAFDSIRLLSLGADGINIARGFMISMGCIQARECNKDTCPVGIATQNKHLERGLVVQQKFIRVKNFHDVTIKKIFELLGSMGIDDISKLDSSYIYTRTSKGDIMSLKEVYG